MDSILGYMQVFVIIKEHWKDNIEDIVLFTGSSEELVLLAREAWGSMILDSACSRTVCGTKWLDEFLGNMSEANLIRVAITTSSKVFNFGLVTYSNQAKIKALKLNKIILKKYGAVSPECCLAMVNNLSKISKANINVSITGIAGPKGGTNQKPIGLVYIGVKRGNKTLVNKYLFKLKKRSLIQKASVRKALDLVLRVSK